MGEIGAAFGLAVGLVASGDRELFAIIALSLRVSLTATLIAFAIGAPLGAMLATTTFAGRQVAISVANAMMGLPPVVAGLFVYLMLSRSGPLGSLGLLFTPGAMIIAQSVLTLPIVVALVHRSLSALEAEYGGAMRVDGAPPLRRALTLIAMGRAALVTAALAAFGRAIAEVGAILVVGGNIRGHTRTMTTAIALETSRGELALALALGMVLISIVLVIATAGVLFARTGRA